MKSLFSKTAILMLSLAILAFSPPSAVLGQTGGCDPGWEPVTYVNSTAAYGIVTIGGAAASEGDIVGAFVDGECRAAASVALLDGVAYASLVVNGEAAGEEITFKLWDADECMELNIDTVAQSVPGGTVGYPPDYLELDAYEPVEPVLNAAPVDFDVDAQGGDVTVNVSNTGTGDMSWSAQVVSGSWLSIAGADSGLNAGTVTISVAANTGLQRTGTVQVSSVDASNGPVVVTIAQDGVAVSGNVLTLVPASNVVYAEEDFTADLKIAGSGIWAAMATVKPAGGEFQLVDQGTPGEFFDSSNRFELDSGNLDESLYQVSMSMKYPAEPVYGGGDFATGLTFKPLPGFYGQAQLEVEVKMTGKYGDALPSNAQNVSFMIDDGIHVENGMVGDGIIDGDVKYMDDSPVPAATVTISIGGKSFFVTTGTDGLFRFEELRDLASGEYYTVRASKDTFGAEKKVYDVSQPVTLHFTILDIGLADRNIDGVIDIADFTILANSYGLSLGDQGYDPRADLNRDNTVDLSDLALLGSHWFVN